MLKLKAFAICSLSLSLLTGCGGLKSHLLCSSCDPCGSSCGTTCDTGCGTTCAPACEVCEGCDEDCLEEEAEHDCAKSACIEETLKSKLSLDMEQQICFGALQVDMDKLQKLIDERKEAHAEEQKLYDEYVRAQKDHWKAERERQLREYIDNIPSQDAVDCHGRPVTCCAPPVCPKFELPTPPPRCIVGAAEIPFVVPVTLQVGLDQVEINKPRVCRTQPPCAQPCCSSNNGCCHGGCGDNGCCHKGCGKNCCHEDSCCNTGNDCCTTAPRSAAPAYEAPPAEEAAPPAPAAAARYPRAR